MEVRVQKKKKRFPWDGKKLHTVWKAVAAILVICVLAGGILLIAGRRQQAEAALDPTRYSKRTSLCGFGDSTLRRTGTMGVFGRRTGTCDSEAINRYYTEEQELKDKYSKKGIKTAAVDIGGNVVESIPKILERTLVAAKRNGLISESHVYEGAVTGATREAIDQF